MLGSRRIPPKRMQRSIASRGFLEGATSRHLAAIKLIRPRGPGRLGWTSSPALFLTWKTSRRAS